MKRSFSVSNSLAENIESQFPGFQFPKYLPETIRFISDSFQQNDSQTPWGEHQRQLGYFAYFHTLNAVRLTAVFESLKQVVPDFSSTCVLDFGSGLGASEIAFDNVFCSPKSWLFVESHSLAKKFHQRLKNSSSSSRQWMQLKEAVQKKPDLLIASYSLNELPEAPLEFFQAETVVLVEPSTQFHARRLMALKTKFQQQGYQILAPCTHKGECPLLLNSKKDWCYDRIHFDAPEWFIQLEENLPIKNRTLTFSYLIASKKYQPMWPTNPARIIGDTLKEKGKTRQMVCRSEDREFLSWLKKNGKAPQLPHGALVTLKDFDEKRGQELRNPKISLDTEN